MAELEDFPICGRCNERHAANRSGIATGWQATCVGHGTGKAHPERAGLMCRQLTKPGEACTHHGGGAPQVRKKRAAAKQRAEAEAKLTKLALKWGHPVDIDPVEAVLSSIRTAAGEEAFYAEQAEQLDTKAMVWGITREKTGGDDAGTTREAAPNIWITMRNEARRDKVKFASEAIRAGIELRRIRVAEQHGSEIAGILREVADVLKLTAEQAETFKTAVPAILRRRAAA